MKRNRDNWQGHIDAPDRPLYRLPPLHQIVGHNQSSEPSTYQERLAIPPPQSQRSYQSVALNDQAYAILGDVNIQTPNLAFLHQAGPTEQRRLLLRSLYFEQMNSRKAQIDARASSPEYVEWVWRTSFLSWLEGLEPFFWITGKPGSGKSTLMTHISCSSRTKDILHKNGKQWKIVRFFFDFRAGDSLANSIEGLLRSLLYQVVKQIPEVAELLDHDVFSGSTASWTLSQCLDTLREATEASAYSICAFIDGLDEFEGSYARLIEVIHSVKAHVSGLKLCLASRPYLAFQENFGRFETLVMQEHNHESIDLYTSAQWSSHRIDHKAKLPRELCRRIREKANGVFLWARLAVDELLVDYLAQKPVPELFAQLESMPEEVEEMYQRSLTRMSEPHQQEAAAILYVLLQTEEKLPINKLYAVLAAMQTWGRIGPAVLPIDPGADNSQRGFAILGDLTDQMLSDLLQSRKLEANHPGHIPVRLVVKDSTVECRRDRVQCVSLTHETLRAFLVNSAWLRLRIGELCDFEKGSGHRFWTNVYMTEISSRLLSKDSKLSLDTRILHATTMYINRLKLITLDHVELLLRNAHEDELINILQIWPDWSPLLLMAVEDLPHQLSRMGQHRLLLANRVAPLSRTPIFALHTACCTFYELNITLAADDNRDLDESIRELEGCSCCLYIGSKTLELSYSVTNIGYTVCALALHDLNDLVHCLVPVPNMDSLERQRIFDLMWEAFALKHTGSNTYTKIFDTTVLQYLLNEGCQLEARHLCVYANLWSYELRDEILDFIQANFSGDNLSHATDCRRSTSSIADHFEDWESEGFELLRVVVPILHNVGVRFDKFLNRNKENSVTEYIRSYYVIEGRPPEDCYEYVKMILDIGGDPFFKGISGDAFEVSANILCKVHDGLFDEEVVEDLERVVNLLDEFRNW